MPLTHDLSKLPCATHTRPVSSTLRHSHTTCLNYPTPLTHDLSPVPSATHTGPVWSIRRHSHTCAGTCSLIIFTLIYEDCWHCRYSFYLCVQRYCINVQVYLWSISVPDGTRLASMVHKESWNGKMGEKISQNRHTVILYSTNMIPKYTRHSFPISRAVHYFRAPKKCR